MDAKKLIHGHTKMRNLGDETSVQKSYTRSTGPRTGRLNGVYLETNLQCQLLKDPQKSTITAEWIVVGDSKVEFSEPGDSGSLVFEGKQGTVVGMIIGGVVHAVVNERQWDNITVITPAEQILQWVEEDLGVKAEFGEPFPGIVGKCQ